LLRQLSQKITRSVKHSPAISLSRLIPGYILYARTEGKSDKTITIVTRSVGYLEQFLMSQGLSTNVSDIGPNEFRSFILYLQQKRCFSGHPFNKTQDRGLSGHTKRQRGGRCSVPMGLRKRWWSDLPFHSVPVKAWIHSFYCSIDIKFLTQ
jgi:hypothetical protein